jgi:DNA-binding transcriptional MerR regulator
MTTEQRQSKPRLRIGELAKLANLNPKTIRYYETIGLLPEPRRTASGYRMYTTEDLSRLTFIRSAKNLDFTLGEIQEILAVRERDEVPCPYVLSVVREKLADLHDRIVRLELLSDDLEDLVREAEGLSAEELARKARYCHVIENHRLRERI